MPGLHAPIPGSSSSGSPGPVPRLGDPLIAAPLLCCSGSVELEDPIEELADLHPILGHVAGKETWRVDLDGPEAEIVQPLPGEGPTERSVEEET